MHRFSDFFAEFEPVTLRSSVLALVCIWTTASPVAAAPQAKIENCGWLVPDGENLIQRADPALQPSDPKPLATPPADAKAAYCERDTIMSYVGDERVVKVGLPLVIRSGGREGVLEAAPAVLFDYHKVGDKYLPGKAPSP